jgi:4-hydroxy-tetrahydrodipicolinate synthase
MALTLICRSATTFTPDGALDEEAFRQHLQRLIDSGHGVYLASGGSGESHALTIEELRRVYQAGVACCRGKVPVFANPPEQHTAQATYEHSALAIEAGVELVNVYGPNSLHGYLPTDDEYLAYHDELLSRLRHPVALAPNPILGYSPKPHLVSQLCNKYQQVVAVNLALQTDAYMIEIRDGLKRDVAFYVPITGSLNTLAIGADGLLGAEANILPRTHRAYIDLYEAGESAALAEVYVHLKRFSRFVSGWGASPRWIKMAMRVLGLPGGAGGPRRPYVLPAEAELRAFLKGLWELGIPELREQMAVRTGAA